jgi:hypothetical protein
MDLMDEGLNFMEYMAEQELELTFLLDVDQEYCSLHEWRSKFLEPIMSNLNDYAVWK